MLGRSVDRLATAWLLFWGSLVVVYAHAGGLAFAALAALLGLAGWIVWLLRARTVPVPVRPALISAGLFAVFFLWLGITGSWSGAGPATAVRLAALMALLASVPILMAVQSDWTRTVLAHILMATALGGLAVLLFDVASGYGVSILIDPQGTGNDMGQGTGRDIGAGSLNQRQGKAEMALGRAHVVWAVLSPLILMLFWRRLPRRRAVVAGALFLALLLAGSQLNRLTIAPMIAFGALPLIAIGYRAPRWGLGLSLGTLVLSVLFAPIIGIASRLAGESVMARLPMSWDHRLRMWDYSWGLIEKKPLTGHGLDISRALDAEFTTRIGVDWPIVSLHPHNVGVQTWLEAGAIGAVLLALALLSLHPLLQRVCRNDPARCAAVSGLLMATALGSAVTVGAWQYWWWGLVGLGLIWTLLIPLSGDAMHGSDARAD